MEGAGWVELLVEACRGGGLAGEEVEKVVELVLLEPQLVACR